MRWLTANLLSVLLSYRERKEAISWRLKAVPISQLIMVVVVVVGGEGGSGVGLGLNRP